MVVYRLIFVLLFVLRASLYGESVHVEAQVNTLQSAEYGAIPVTLSISRSDSASLDENSFLLEGSCLLVEHLGEQTESRVIVINGRRSESKTVVSNYRFYLPGKSAGNYMLPPITVKIDGKTYQTTPTPYQIVKGEERSDFSLQAFIDGPAKLFPGMRFSVVYRYQFRDQMAFAVEKLPLLDGNAFKKVGQLNLGPVTACRGGYQRDVRQDFEATHSGEYVYEPSIVEGYIYQQDFMGRRRYLEPRLRAMTPEKTIVVHPFPLPPSQFTGTIGGDIP